jgi:Flp pilus assembly pilin Flp
MVQMRPVLKERSRLTSQDEKVEILSVSSSAVIEPSVSCKSFRDGGGEIMFQFFHALRSREEGQTLVEYALILALVSIGSVFALGQLSIGINGVFDTVVGAL